MNSQIQDSATIVMDIIKAIESRDALVDQVFSGQCLDNAVLMPMLLQGFQLGIIEECLKCIDGATIPDGNKDAELGQVCRDTRIIENYKGYSPNSLAACHCLRTSGSSKIQNTEHHLSSFRCFRQLAVQVFFSRDSTLLIKFASFISSDRATAVTSKLSNCPNREDGWSYSIFVVRLSTS